MENEKIDILDREGRENDLDDLNLEEFRFEEGVDYKAYLKKVREDIGETEVDPGGTAAAKAGEAGPPKSRKKKARKGKSVSDLESRTTLIAFMTSKQTGNALRILAALSNKTLSTLVNDSVKAYLKTEIDNVISTGILDQVLSKGEQNEGKNG